MISRNKDRIPKIIGISKEWQEKLDEARKYLGNGKYIEEKRDRRYLGDRSILAKKAYKAPKIHLHQKQNNG